MPFLSPPPPPQMTTLLSHPAPPVSHPAMVQVVAALVRDGESASPLLKAVKLQTQAWAAGGTASLPPAATVSCLTGQALAPFLQGPHGDVASELEADVRRLVWAAVRAGVTTRAQWEAAFPTVFRPET